MIVHIGTSVLNMHQLPMQARHYHVGQKWVYLFNYKLTHRVGADWLHLLNTSSGRAWPSLWNHKLKEGKSQFQSFQGSSIHVVAQNRTQKRNESLVDSFCPHGMHTLCNSSIQQPAAKRGLAKALTWEMQVCCSSSMHFYTSYYTQQQSASNPWVLREFFKLKGLPKYNM